VPSRLSWRRLRPSRSTTVMPSLNERPLGVLPFHTYETLFASHQLERKFTRSSRGCQFIHPLFFGKFHSDGSDSLSSTLAMFWSAAIDCCFAFSRSAESLKTPLNSRDFKNVMAERETKAVMKLRTPKLAVVELRRVAEEDLPVQNASRGSDSPALLSRSRE